MGHNKPAMDISSLVDAALRVKLTKTSSAIHLRLPYGGLQLRMTRKICCILVLSSVLLSSVLPSLGAPVELLQNGSFKNGLDGWIVEGRVFLNMESVRVMRLGSLSQVVGSPDLSFYLELSYSVRTDLPSKASFARSLVTFYVVDRQKRDTHFTIVGDTHGGLGDSGWKDVRLNLLQLFRNDIGDPGNFQLSALKVTMELGFTTYVTFPLPVAYFRNISLRRVNPVKILLSESGRRELPDKTELITSLTNAGDVDASNLVVTLIPGADIIVISEATRFERPTLEGRTSWQLSWMLAARSSGVHPVVIKAGCDQGSAELSLSVPIQALPQITTTHTSTVTSTLTIDHATQQVNIMFTQIALVVLVILLTAAILIPMFRRRRGPKLIYRLRTLPNQSTQFALD